MICGRSKLVMTEITGASNFISTPLQQEETTDENIDEHNDFHSLFIDQQLLHRFNKRD
jgi:hypothetical protein